MAVIFPDLELLLVSYFNTALAAQGTALATDVRVGTKHTQPDEELPAKQIVIQASYNGETVDRVTQLGSAVIDVYADDYGTASQLSLLVDALVRGCTGEHIKRATVRLIARTSEEGMQERRSLDVEFIIKGTDL